MSRRKTELLAALALFICVVSGCQMTNAPSQQNALAASSAAAPAEVIYLSRQTDAYGTDPEYTLRIYDDGTVEFDGKQNVKTKGVSKVSISREAVRDLIAEFEKMDFLSLKGSYVGNPYKKSEGCPQFYGHSLLVYLTFKHEGKSKTVVHDRSCVGSPVLEKLEALGNKIDQVANTKQWIR